METLKIKQWRFWILVYLCLCLVVVFCLYIYLFYYSSFGLGQVKFCHICVLWHWTPQWANPGLGWPGPRGAVSLLFRVLQFWHQCKSRFTILLLAHFHNLRIYWRMFHTQPQIFVDKIEKIDMYVDIHKHSWSWSCIKHPTSSNKSAILKIFVKLPRPSCESYFMDKGPMCIDVTIGEL